MKIGIVYAISQSAGELCKRTLNELSDSKVSIVTHENPSHLYKEAADNIESIADLLKSSIDILVQKGATIIIISANSVHRAFSIVNLYVKDKYPRVSLLSIVTTAVDEIQDKGYKNVAVFGSNSTLDSQIYQSKFNELAINTVKLPKEDQSYIHKLISSGVSPTTITPEILNDVRNIAQRAKVSGAEVVILACAELPIIFNAKNLGISVIDTNKNLVLGALNKIKQHRY